jgi:hypothetical protein
VRENNDSYTVQLSTSEELQVGVTMCTEINTQKNYKGKEIKKLI